MQIYKGPALINFEEFFLHLSVQYVRVTPNELEFFRTYEGKESETEREKKVFDFN